MSKILYSVLVLIVLGLIGGGVYIARNIYTSAPKLTSDQGTAQSLPTSKPESNIEPSLTSAVIPTKTVRYPGTKEYTSNPLNIAFSYLPDKDGVKFSVKESGEKVYVYMDNTKPEDGQFVEVFTKDPQLSLKDAIKAKFLTGKSESDCFVIDTTEKFKNYPASYSAAEISFPPTEDLPELEQKSSFCSADYARTNGVRYFLMDNNHPDTFAFFSIGQYGIPAGDKISWQDTISFVD